MAGVGVEQSVGATFHGQPLGRVRSKNVPLYSDPGI
jgi:hypothetical protein